MTYISIDIETDGPIPGDFSMLSLGAVAFDEKGKEISEFSANLEPLFGAHKDPKTMKWWADRPEAWKAATENSKPPLLVMNEFSSWALSMKPVTAVCYPSGFDWTFVYWYLMHFTGQSPFGMSALDMKSYACSKLGTKFRGTTKKEMPREWFSNEHRHTHVAVEDAREQGHIFFKMRSHK